MVKFEFQAFAEIRIPLSSTPLWKPNSSTYRFLKGPWRSWKSSLPKRGLPSNKWFSKRSTSFWNAQSTWIFWSAHRAHAPANPLLAFPAPLLIHALQQNLFWMRPVLLLSRSGLLPHGNRIPELEAWLDHW